MRSKYDSAGDFAKIAWTQLIGDCLSGTSVALRSSSPKESFGQAEGKAKCLF